VYARGEVTNKSFKDALVGTGTKEGRGEVTFWKDTFGYCDETPKGFFVCRVD